MYAHLVLSLSLLASQPQAKWAWTFGPPEYGQTPPVASKELPKPAKPSLLILEIPPGAQLWIDGVQQYGTGEMVRYIETPPLEEGFIYTYTVKVRGVDKSEETVKLDIRPGESRRWSFIRLKPVEFKNLMPGSPSPMRAGR